MTKCYQNTIRFSSVQRRKVEDEFSGGAITGNEDIPLLAVVDQHLGLTCSVSKYLGDAQRQGQLKRALFAGSSAQPARVRTGSGA